MPHTRRARQMRAPSAEQQAPAKVFDIPYFAHQHLDPEHFPHGVGMPISDSPASAASYGAGKGAQGAWEDSDEGADAESEDEYFPKTSTIQPKRRISSATHIDANAYKRMKVSGGRPAIAKRVTADMDSDDDMIVRMKNAKYLEKDIATRLAEEGRIAYNPKTIGTRWARLKKAMQKRQDELLDAELTDWHEGDDDALYQAIQKAEEDVAKAKADVDARKWRIVADQIKVLKPVVNFSQYACRTRYEALQAGTAKPTPESIPCPDSRTLARIYSRQEKEEKIRLDQEYGLFGTEQAENIEGNAWTSRMRTYY